MPSTTELLQEADWRRYANDEVAFFREMWKVKHPEKGAIPFELYDSQREMLGKMQTEKQLICLKARQIGWSTIVASHCFYVAFFNQDRDILFISRTEDEATKLLGFVTYGYDHLPAWVKERGPKRLDNNLTKITFGNYSSIESRPSKQDPARGRTAYITVVDEWAFLGEGRTEDQEKAWASLKPTADIGGRIFGLSTANGAGNFFHAFWQKAEAGTSGFVPLFLPWNAVPGRTSEWYEAQKRDMLPWQLSQEFPATPDEAFIKSGNPVFDTDLLQRLTTEEPRRGWLAKDAYGSTYTFNETGSGELRLWDLPDPNEAYVMGCDVAQGLEHGDYSVAYVGAVAKPRIVACWYGHIDPDLFAERINELGRFFNRALVGVESNSFGLGTCTHLRRLRYPRIYYRRGVREGVAGNQQKMIGWLTNEGTKPYMVSEFNRAVREGAIDVRDPALVAEMLTYVRDDKGRMEGSPFDDRVMAACIMNEMRKFAHAPVHTEKVDDYMTLNWWERQLEPQREPLIIGRNNVRKSWL